MLTGGKTLRANASRSQQRYPRCQADIGCVWQRPCQLPAGQGLHLSPKHAAAYAEPRKFPSAAARNRWARQEKHTTIGCHRHEPAVAGTRRNAMDSSSGS